MRPLGGLLGLAGLALVAAVGCSRAYVAPVLPAAYTEQIDAPYDAVWRALVRALARENVQIRTIARDSGGIASEAVPTTIGLYADSGRFGGEPRGSAPRAPGRSPSRPSGSPSRAPRRRSRSTRGCARTRTRGEAGRPSLGRASPAPRPVA